MKLSTSRIAQLSGIFTSVGFVPHLLFLSFLFFMKMPVPLSFLILMYPACIILGEYLFYQETVQNISFVNWLKLALHPTNPGYFASAYLSEILFVMLFLSLALKFQWDPLHFYLLLIGCKFLAAPLQTYLSYRFLSKNVGFALAVITQVPLFLLAKNNPAIFLYVVILNGVLCNGIAIARSQFATEMHSRGTGI